MNIYEMRFNQKTDKDYTGLGVCIGSYELRISVDWYTCKVGSELQ